MKTKAIVAVLAAILAISTAHAAERATVEVQNIKPNCSGCKMIDAVVKVTNTSGAPARSISISCALLDNGRAIDTGVALVRNVDAGQAAYDTIHLSPGAATSRDVQCRVSAVNQ